MAKLLPKVKLVSDLVSSLDLDERTVDFNKELLGAEIGGIIGAPSFGWASSYLFSASESISLFTVVGSVFGAAISWLLMRIRHERRRGEFSYKKLTTDMSYFTPAAFIIALVVAYPTIFFVTRALLKTFKTHPILSSLGGEVCGFFLFLVFINIYRWILKRHYKKVL